MSITSKVCQILLQSGVMLKGDFTLKDGSKSPYFFDLGRISLGAKLVSLAIYLDLKINDRGLEYDVIVGPPYKAITLAALMSISANKPFDFYRKETKDHGEGGDWVTKALKPGMKVLLVDDVFTGGTAKLDAIARVEEMGAEVVGIGIILDRNRAGMDRLLEFQGIPVVSLVTMAEMLQAAEVS